MRNYWIKMTVPGVLGAVFILAACEKDQTVSNSYVVTTPAELPVPIGFPPPEIPVDNPQTVEGINLGRHLFYDKRLSDDNTQACASCHLQDYAFSDFNQFSTGIDGIEGDKNAMAIINLAWQDFFFWDGRSVTMEEQAEEPVINPIEMHTTWDKVLMKLEADPEYQAMFTAAFGPNSFTKENATKAIAQFERTMISGNSKFDQGFAVTNDVLQPFPNFTDQENRGKDLFFNEQGDCFHCHSNPTFGAFGELQFSNNGLDSVLAPGSGREGVSGDPADRGKFKVTTLRNIEFSFPYMHDGRFQNLQEVIEFYNFGGHVTPTLDPNMKAAGVGRNWTQTQKDDLLAFLFTLSDIQFLTDTTFADPF